MEDETSTVTPKRRLDLACGNNKRAGFIGVDRSREETQADVAHDLEVYPWPFPDSYADEVYCSHFIEHVSDLVAFINELWRILKPGSAATFVAPYYTSVWAIQDPTHKRFIAEQTFLYFDRDWREANRLSHYPIVSDFKIEKTERSVSPAFSGKTDDEIAYAAMHYWNVINEIAVTLKKPG